MSIVYYLVALIAGPVAVIFAWPHLGWPSLLLAPLGASLAALTAAGMLTGCDGVATGRAQADDLVSELCDASEAMRAYEPRTPAENRLRA